MPKCPTNLAGVLTHPLIDPKYISALTPLGNVNGAGHFAPTDHIYFASDYSTPVPQYAPAKAWITGMMEVSHKEADGSWASNGFVITMTPCKGLYLDLAEYTEIKQPLKDAIAGKDPKCIEEKKHDFYQYGERTCSYSGLEIKVTAGQELGSTQKMVRSDGETFPFEIWAANYNKLSRDDINWDYYPEERYHHTFCLFDLYKDEIKNQYLTKFGLNAIVGNEKKVVFQKRTVEPLCGTINQNLANTIQGDWFGGAPSKSSSSLEGEGKSISFIHYNFDPTKGVVSSGSEITGKQINTIIFDPKNSGTIDREPSQVKADSKIYCYNGGEKNDLKILVQLQDEHHIKVESQPGTCTTTESFSNPFTYER